jgi:hypothetical protein
MEDACSVCIFLATHPIRLLETIASTNISTRIFGFEEKSLKCDDEWE